MARTEDRDAPLQLACSCGQLRATMPGAAARSGTHVACHCSDCRAGQLHLGQPDPAPGPVDLFQTTPDNIELTSGADHLGLFRLSPKGLFRWYATCCNSPLFNTSTSAKVPFVSLPIALMDTPERVGPIIAEVNIRKPDGKKQNKGLARALLKLLPAILATRLSGRWRRTPFFDIETGKPVVAPHILSKDARAALYPAGR